MPPVRFHNFPAVYTEQNAALPIYQLRAKAEQISQTCTLDKCYVIGYNINMIKSFKHKGLEKFFLTGSTRGIQAIHARKISYILITLDNANTISDCDLCGFKLHPLKGDMKNQWFVTVQANWRITFEFDDETKNVYIVDYQDYY